MAVLFLRILGNFDARRSTSEPVEIPIRKGKALLAFLALKPGEAVARSKLTGLLWGDRSEEQARTSLRQTLTVLRKALGPVKDQALRTDRQSVGLDSAGLDVDAMSFQNLIARGAPADLETAVSLYRGELLEDLDLPDPGFQAWLEDERRRFHGLMAAALHALMEQRRADGAPQAAVVLAESLLALEPLREDVHCALMVLYAELGRRDAVYRQYHRCRDLLASELNVEPAAETDALYQMLLNNDRPLAGWAEEKGAIVVSRQETDPGAKVAADEWSECPPVAVTSGWRGSRRWAAAAGRTLIIGGIAAFTWLLAWGHPFTPVPPDIMAFLRIDVLSSDDLSSVREDVSKSAGPDSLDRMALQQPGRPSPAMPSFGGPPGVPEVVSKSGGWTSQDRFALALLDGRSLAMRPGDNPSGMRDGVTETSGPVALNRVAASLPGQPARAVASVDSLSRVLEGVTGVCRRDRP